MTYSDISALRELFKSSIENLDLLWEVKSEAALAKQYGEKVFEDIFRKSENQYEDALISNMAEMVRYIKQNMNEVSESHEGVLLNLVS